MTSLISEISDERNDQFRLTYLRAKNKEKKSQERKETSVKKIKHDFTIYLNMASNTLLARGIEQDMFRFDIP